MGSKETQSKKVINSDDLSHHYYYLKILAIIEWAISDRIFKTLANFFETD